MLGSGTGGGATPVSALMMALSPSAKSGGVEGRTVAVSKEESTVVGVPLTSIVVGDRSPVKMASVGCGLTPPMPIEVPSHDWPSEAKVK